MSDNVLPLPGRIERLVRAIQNDLQRQATGDRDWIEASYDLCLHLAELRDQFAADIEFGRACESHGFGKSVINADTRAAAIAMAREPEALRACLEATQRRSLEHIYRQEFDRFRRAPKPTRQSARKRPEAKKEQHALDVYDRMTMEGRTFDRQDLAREAGVSSGTAARAFARREMEESVRAVEPLDPATAPPKVRERMEAWQRAERKRLRAIVDAELKAEYDLSADVWVRQVWERAAWAEKILAASQGLMPKSQYQTIVKCLHPDTMPDAQLKAEAFRLFTRHKDVLIKPELVFSGPALPSLGELLARRRDKR